VLCRHDLASSLNIYRLGIGLELSCLSSYLT
jgi:hypothetical protein